MLSGSLSKNLPLFPKKDKSLKAIKLINTRYAYYSETARTYNLSIAA